MLSTLAENIHDGRFLRLIGRMLKAGYLEDWRWNATLSGCPQGGVASPVLSNIYLDRLDRFVEQTLIPQHTRGKKRRRYPAYGKLKHRIAKARKDGDREAVRDLTRQARQLPSGDPNDPAYRRLRYARYADDFLLGFAGPRDEAEQIKVAIGQFLHDELKLDLSESKTLITHAGSQSARFLGYDVRTQHQDTKITRGRRSVNGRVALFVPRRVIRERSKRYLRKGRPTHLGALLSDTDFSIVAKYGAEWRGIVQYYLLAQDVYRLDRLRYVMELSMLRTLANKHKSTVRRTARKHRAQVETPDGYRRCYEATVTRSNGRKPLVARFGGIPLKRKRSTIILDRKPIMTAYRSNELIHRLLAGRCEICEGPKGLQVHHVRKLADLNKPGRRETPIWIKMMAQKRRKTLVVCMSCHHSIHGGRGTTSTRK